MLFSPTKAVVLENVVITSPHTTPPDIDLAELAGHRGRLSSYRGSAVVLTFVLTRCTNPDFCPRILQHFATLEREIALDPRLASTTRLLVISAEPERDTPESVSAYVGRLTRRHGAPRLWSFGVGRPDETAALARFFGLQIATRGGQWTHNLRTAVLGPSGEVARIFEGNTWTPGDVVDTLRAIETGQMGS
jgi:protein SCO1/2